MQNRYRFYIDSHGPDDDAAKQIIRKAIELEMQLGNVSRIVFVAHGLQHDGWLERLYGSNAAKKLRTGAQLPQSAILAKFESLKTYQPRDFEIIITLGLDSDEILLLDDNYDINAILALPWVENGVNKWANITNAINIDDNIAANSFANPPCIVIKALEALTRSINMSTGLLNSSDDNMAKTYLRALVKYSIPLQQVEIESYLIKHLNWTKEHADHLLKIIEKINEGRSFQGGEKTGLQHHFNRWKEACVG